jgi:hypothetical protein
MWGIRDTQHGSDITLNCRPSLLASIFTFTTVLSSRVKLMLPSKMCILIFTLVKLAEARMVKDDT